MVKKHTTMNIDHKVLEKAREMGINMSEVAENALKKQYGQTLDTPDEDLSCFKCNRKMRKATADDLDGLVWLNPEEVWCCPECEKRRIKAVMVAV